MNVTQILHILHILTTLKYLNIYYTECHEMVHGFQLMYPNNFSDHLTFHLAPSSAQNLPSKLMAFPLDLVFSAN